MYWGVGLVIIRCVCIVARCSTVIFLSFTNILLLLLFFSYLFTYYLLLLL